MDLTPMHHLPVYDCRDEIIAALRTSRVVVVAGETGSGKSTCLPLICRSAGFGENRRIAVTQPRRIAAVSLAAYSRSLAGGVSGGEIGYKVRYRQSIDAGTRIVYMTDGVLLASLAADPLLMQYDVIIIDEAHERSVTIDFLLGYLRTLLARRSDLRCIIASATLATRLFSRAFNHAPVITVKGRRYDVDLHYRPVIELWKGYSIDSFIEGAIVAALEIVNTGQEGDLLIFMPTVDDVIATVVRLQHRLGRNVAVLPLHSRLPLHRQQEVFAPHSGRKIVVATNIAETSLTVPAIRFVIDTGLARVLRYEPDASLTRMPVEKISRASADQRSGRCGRVRDGVCLRLFSEQDYLSRPQFTLPEIKRTGLAGLILRMHALHLGDPARFPFLQRPPPKAIAEGYRMLQELGALDKNRNLTAAGRAIARFPLDPQVGCMLISAKRYGVLEEVTVIAAALAAQDPLCGADGEPPALPGKFIDPRSDFMVFLKVWQRLDGLRRGGKGHVSPRALTAFCNKYGFQPMRIREWMDTFDHLRRICSDIPGCALKEGTIAPDSGSSYTPIHKSLLSGLVHGCAQQKEPHRYEGIGATEIRIASASVTAKKNYPWLLFHEITETGQVYGARAAVIEPAWVEELFGSSCRYRYEDPHFNPISGKVTFREEVGFKSLTLIKNRLVDGETIDRRRAVEVFAREALTDGAVGERYRFIMHNRQVLHNIAVLERKLRKPLYAGDEALTDFYLEQAPVATRKELNEAIRRRGGDAFLMVPMERLLLEPLPPDMDDYSDEIVVASYRLPVTWMYDDAADADGATVRVPERLARALPYYYWEWQLPVLRKLRETMAVARLTDRFIDKDVDPADAVDALSGALRVPKRPYCSAAAQLLETRFGIPAEEVATHFRQLPGYLWLRVNVIDEKGIMVDSFRPPATIQRRFGKPREELAAILAPIAGGIEQPPPFQWEGTALLQHLERQALRQKVPCVVYPALWRGGQGIGVKLFSTVSRATDSHAAALRYLLGEELAEKLAWEIETVKPHHRLVEKSGTTGQRVHDALCNITELFVGQLPAVLPTSRPAFELLLAEAQRRVPGSGAMVTRLFERVFDGLERCRGIGEKRKLRYPDARYRVMHEELEKVLGDYRNALFSGGCSVDFLMHLPDYLDAFPRRSSAAFLDTVKYRVVMAEVYESERLIEVAGTSTDYSAGIEREQLRIMVQEYIMYQFGGAVKKGGVAWSAADLAAKRSDVVRAIVAETGLPPWTGSI